MGGRTEIKMQQKMSKGCAGVYDAIDVNLYGIEHNEFDLYVIYRNEYVEQNL